MGEMNYSISESSAVGGRPDAFVPIQYGSHDLDHKDGVGVYNTMSISPGENNPYGPMNGPSKAVRSEKSGPESFNWSTLFLIGGVLMLVYFFIF